MDMVMVHSKHIYTAASCFKGELLHLSGDLMLF